MRRNFERRNAQTSRKGWRPKKTSDAQLAIDIAQSMSENPGRSIENYTSRIEIAEMVQQILQSK